MAIKTRETTATGVTNKGAPLTNAELDNNFVELVANKVELDDLSVTTNSAGTAALSYDNTTGVFSYTPPDLSNAGGGIELTDLSVTTNSAGTAALSYSNSTGVFTYTPPDLSGYLTSYTETDTLDSVTGRGATTTNAITVGGLTVDTDTLSVDATNDRVGINESSPTEDLHITGTGDATILIEGTGSQSPTTYNGVASIKLNSMQSGGLERYAIWNVQAPSTNFEGSTIHFTGQKSGSQVNSQYVGATFQFWSGNGLACKISDSGVQAASFQTTATGSTTAITLSDLGRVTTGENLVVTGDASVGGDLTATGTVTASGGNSTNWNTAYGWGDHSLGGYIENSGFVEMDTAGTDFIVKDSNNTQGITNFIWRDHSAAKLYLGSSDDDVTIRGSSGIGWTNDNTNQIYFSFIGGACKRLTTQGGLIIGVDSSVILHAGDNVNSLKGTYSIVDGTTSEILYLTADGNVTIASGHQTSGGSTSYQWDFRSDGWLALPKAQGVNTGSVTIMKAGTTGDYGSVIIDGGATNSWEGYSIGGRAVFMHNNSNTTGIYNDVNNQWILKNTHNAETSLYHAGVQKGYTYSSGFRVTGNLLATANVTAYYSDERLKEKTGKIENALDKVDAIDTFYYTHNDTANELGYEGKKQQVGVSAQSVAAVMPEVVHLAPIDDDGKGNSVSGKNYQTVDYPRLIPLLLESIKELRAEVEALRVNSV